MLSNITNLKVFKWSGWDVELIGNTLGEYAVAFLVFLGGLVVLKIIQVIILNRLKKLADKTETDIDNTFIAILRSISPPFYSFLAVYVALRFIYVAPWLNKLVNIVLIAWVIYQAVKALEILTDFVIRRIVGKEVEPDEASKKAAIELLAKIAKGVLWVIGGLVALSNFGVNVTSLIAGLGIGGVAVALAAQSILGDLFSSFVIFFDKPFEVGDFITVGDKKGVVEEIGVKTTKIKSISGEQIVMSNTQMTSSAIQNYGRMEDRRATLSFGVEYGTDREKLERIPEMVQNIVEDVEDVEFDRVFFDKFGDSAIVFELVFFVKSPEYEVYGEKNQQIAFEINKRFQQEGISMAFPTRTVYMHQSNSADI